MSKLITIKTFDNNTYKVMPRWRGWNLAVHAPVIDDNYEQSDRKWVITHLRTGYMAGGYFYGSLSQAIKTAKRWDASFGIVTTENADRWPLREQWKKIIGSGRFEAPRFATN